MQACWARTLSKGKGNKGFGRRNDVQLDRLAKTSRCDHKCSLRKAQGNSLSYPATSISMIPSIPPALVFIILRRSPSWAIMFIAPFQPVFRSQTRTPRSSRSPHPPASRPDTFPICALIALHCHSSSGQAARHAHRQVAHPPLMRGLRRRSCCRPMALAGLHRSQERVWHSFACDWSLACRRRSKELALRRIERGNLSGGHKSSKLGG